MNCDWCGPSLGSCKECPDHGDPSAAAIVPSSCGYDCDDDRLDHAVWRSEHLCAECALSSLCRWAPGEDAPLVCVSRCRAFLTSG